MRYLVTGGCGFIGSHLVDALIKQGHDVDILDNLSTGKRENAHKQANVIVGDICDEILVASLVRNADGCFHLAAVASVQKSVEAWLSTHKTNASGTVTIFDAIAHQKTQIPVVYASSAAVYGDNPKMPLTEDTPVNPITAYGADKYSCEVNGKVAYLVHGIPTLGLRFFNVYGPRQDPKSPYSGVISIFSNHIADNKPIKVFGDGEQMRDFIYVQDVVETMMRGMSQLSSRKGAWVLNVCTGQGTTLNRLIHTLEEVAGQRAISEYCPSRAGDIRVSLGDNHQLQRFLDHRPSIELHQGLSSLILELKGHV
ncbi:MAG: NAD-dependent epimerase/dehydratase family protein [Alphaproteobacteria bacterium]|nr:NAD-dependent epimerase/dehydratase family protein [Alphaproteobacteria bacterium]